APARRRAGQRRNSHRPHRGDSSPTGSRPRRAGEARAARAIARGVSQAAQREGVVSNALGISAVTAVLEYLFNSVYPGSGLGSVTVTAGGPATRPKPPPARRPS